eukprot:12991148-Ditylum_brightwellii.AAC.1
MKGLKKRILIGNRIIADSGYNGEQDIISTENYLDPREIDYFKDHVLSQHEIILYNMDNGDKPLLDPYP